MQGLRQIPQTGLPVVSWESQTNTLLNIISIRKPCCRRHHAAGLVHNPNPKPLAAWFKASTGLCCCTGNRSESTWQAWLVSYLGVVMGYSATMVLGSCNLIWGLISLLMSTCKPSCEPSSPVVPWNGGETGEILQRNCNTYRPCKPCDNPDPNLQTLSTSANPSCALEKLRNSKTLTHLNARGHGPKPSTLNPEPWTPSRPLLAVSDLQLLGVCSLLRPTMRLGRSKATR